MKTIQELNFSDCPIEECFKGIEKSDFESYIHFFPYAFIGNHVKIKHPDKQEEFMDKCYKVISETNLKVSKHG